MPGIGKGISPIFSHNKFGGITPPVTYIIATGGLIERDGNYLIHTLSDGDTFEVIQESNSLTYNQVTRLIGGGGGSGSYSNGSFIGFGGGGGAGQVQEDIWPAAVGVYGPCSIGIGGTGGTTATDGIDTVFMGITMKGGAQGSAVQLDGLTQSAPYPGNGGGAGGNFGSGPGLAKLGGIGLQHNGGKGSYDSSGGSDVFIKGGGGGGASANGSDATTSAIGVGGVGLISTIDGLEYGKGGDGGESVGVSPMVNAVRCGGGRGASNISPTTAGNGGDGVIKLKYYSPGTSYTSLLILSNNPI